jgi:6-phosphogluconolactonase
MAGYNGMKINKYADREMLALDVADMIALELEQALLHEERVSFAAPGGTSPAPIFEALSEVRHIDWARVDVLLTDERWVPPDHARSNAKLIQENLLKGAAGQAMFLPLYGEGDIAHVVAQKSKLAERHLPISVLLLGMGTDMHTASLFPNAPELNQALDPSAPAYCVLSPLDQPEPRVSLSGQAISGALSKHLVIFGDAKLRALEQAQSLSPQAAPVQVALQDLIVHWAP